MVKWGALQLLMREGSNFNPETVIRDKFSWFSSVPPDMLGHCLKLGKDGFLECF
jgi:hypothetical protein